MQKRSQLTRSKLLDAARRRTAVRGYEALRVEDVVADAGVAKGTFFAHFKDKDALMEILLATEIDKILGVLERAEIKGNVSDLVRALRPFVDFVTSERYVFDVVLRHSGAAAKADIGPIALSFDRLLEILGTRMQQFQRGPSASDRILAEGVQAFALQAMAFKFCAVNSEMQMDERLQSYLELWLAPRT